MKRATLLAMAFLAMPSPAAAKATVIRIWGPAAMRGIAERWSEAYGRLHPDVSFELTLRGSDTAIPGLYGGQADIALMGRPNDDVDDAGFSRPLGYPVTRIAIANGSVSTPGKAEAVAVLVDARNPIAALSTAQLASILDCGGSRPPASRWGDVGAGDGWAARPIRVYATDFGTRTGRFVEHVVTHDDRRLCWDAITERVDALLLDGTLDQSVNRAAAVARGDPSALVIADAAQAHDGLKVVALTGSDGRPAFPDAPDIVAGRYPLARRAYAFVDRRPGSAIPRPVAGFLEWVLSDDGQSLLAADRGFLPLDAGTMAAGRRLLEGGR